MSETGDEENRVDQEKLREVALRTVAEAIRTDISPLPTAEQRRSSIEWVTKKSQADLDFLKRGGDDKRHTPEDFAMEYAAGAYIQGVGTILGVATRSTDFEQIPPQRQLAILYFAYKQAAAYGLEHANYMAQRGDKDVDAQYARQKFEEEQAEFLQEQPLV